VVCPPDGGFVESSAGTGDHQDEGLCHECGGLCCCLYLAHDENGDYIGHDWLPAYIELWVERLSDSGALTVAASGLGAGVAGIEPLHDPRISHLPTTLGARYRAGLPDWVDVRKCQFCHPESGCLLPREYRAPICRDYRCDLWDVAADSFAEADHG
jgi:hypothetical protein